MANNEERFCNHCGRETLFVLESDHIWCCDECEHPFESNPVMDIDSDEYLNAREEIEEENGPSVYCQSCGNFLTLTDVLENDGHCSCCGEEIRESEMERHGYFLNDDMEWEKNK